MQNIEAEDRMQKPAESRALSELFHCEQPDDAGHAVIEKPCVVC